MLARFRAFYAAYRWVRLVACAGLGVSVLVLLVAGGGFPPWAWRFLFQVITQLPRLWEQHGLGMLLPLLALLLLALTLCLLWGGILLAAAFAAREWLRRRRDLQEFRQEMAEARRSVASFDTSQAAPLFAASAPSAYYASAPGSNAYQAARSSRPAGRIPIMVADADYEPSIISLEVGTALDAGIKRRGQANEDSLLALPTLRASRKNPQPLALFIVADGMGGHGHGQEASRMAITSLHDALQLALIDHVSDDLYEELLAEGVHNANLAIYQQNRQKQSDMGTTLTAALIAGNTAYIANVGDSRTYLYREGEGLSQITRDHSAVARLVEVGAITQRDVYTHPKRNEIYRSLGHSSSIKVDTYNLPLKVGDLLLLCSDGLWEMVYDDDIAHTIESWLPAPAHICEALLQAALRGGGKDNISIVAVRVKSR